MTGTPAGDRDGPSAAGGRDWRRAQAAFDGDLRLHLAELVADAADDLAGDFYRVLLADPEAAPLLSHDLVRTRLRASLAGWLCRLFAAEPCPISTPWPRSSAISARSMPGSACRSIWSGAARD
ncbi:hypothetical protein ACFQ4K_30635 [Tistrella bauzanensis]